MPDYHFPSRHKINPEEYESWSETDVDYTPDGALTTILFILAIVAIAGFFFLLSI